MSDLLGMVLSVGFVVFTTMSQIIADMKPGINKVFHTGSDRHRQTISPLFQLLEVFSQLVCVFIGLLKCVTQNFLPVVKAPLQLSLLLP